MSIVKRNITLIYVIAVFQSMVFAYVIERVFGASRGLTVLDMQYLLILYSLFSILFEIPAGIVADLWKKKYTLALGVAICFFEFFVSIFSYSLPMFSIAYFAAGLGGSLKSGTMESILYQTLKEQDQESLYIPISGRLKFIKYTVSGIAALVGGYIADIYGYEMNYWLSLMGFPISILLILSLYEPGGNKHTLKRVDYSALLTHMKSGIRITWENPQLRKVVLVSAVVGGILYGQLHEMSMLIYPELGISLKFFGFVSIGIMITSALSGFFANQLNELLKNSYLYPLIYLITGVAIFIFGTIDKWWGVLFLIAAIGVLEALTIVYSGIIQKESPDEIRVTISSISSFFLNGISVVIGLLFGYFAQWFTIHGGFQFLATILFILAILQTYIDVKQRLKGKYFTKIS